MLEERHVLILLQLMYFSDPFVVVCTFLVMKLFSVCKFFFVH
jgi:hypothetical protein